MFFFYKSIKSYKESVKMLTCKNRKINIYKTFSTEKLNFLNCITETLNVYLLTKEVMFIWNWASVKCINI